jgi:hypothetical protein
MGVGLKSFVVAEDRTSACLIAQEEASEPMAQLGRHFVDRGEMSRAGRALDLEVIAVVVMELL